MRILVLFVALCQLGSAWPWTKRRAVKVAWADSVNPSTSTTYKVYRTGGNCPATSFNKVLATSLTTKAFSDNAPVGYTYCYGVTAVIGTKESPKGMAQITVPRQ